MQTNSAFIFFIIGIFISSFAQAKLEFPKQLNSDEQKKIVQILGFGFTPGLSTHLIPLGGFDGAEVSLGYQSVTTEQIAQLGSGAEKSSTILMPQLFLSKGLYEDLDVGIAFTPGIQEEDVQMFHMHGRWSFQPNSKIPYLLGINVYAAGAQWQNLYQNRVLGADLFLVRYFDQFSLHIGLGRARSISQFTGGTDGITASRNNESIDLFENRLFAGFGYQFGKFLFAAQVFRFTQSTYNFNFGYRF